MDTIEVTPWTQAELICVLAFLRDERAGCSREHLDNYLAKIKKTRIDINFVLHPDRLQEQGGALMLIA